MSEQNGDLSFSNSIFLITIVQKGEKDDYRKELTTYGEIR